MISILLNLGFSFCLKYDDSVMCHCLWIKLHYFLAFLGLPEKGYWNANLYSQMDKASLLGEVVSHLKELKRTAAEISKGFLVPMDIDEVRVEQQEGGLDEAPYSIKASLCCDYKPGVLSDLRRALDTVHLKTVRAEIATLGGRMKNVFVMTGCKDGNLEDTETRKLHANSVHQALRSVLDKFPASQDFSSRSTSSNKRQRISIFNSSSSSPFGDFWWDEWFLDYNLHLSLRCFPMSICIGWHSGWYTGIGSM